MDLKSENRQDRRDFLKHSAKAGLLAAMSTWPVSKAIVREPVVLRYMASGVNEFPQIAERAWQDLGIRIEFHPYINFQDSFLRLMTRPQSYELVDVDYGILRHFVKAGIVKNLDARRLKPSDSFISIFTKGELAGKKLSRQGGAPFRYTYMTGQNSQEFAPSPTRWLSAMPTLFNADTLGIRPDLIERPIGNWHELFNPEFAGRSAIINVPGIGILDAALAIESGGGYTYRDKGNMTRAEIDHTVGVLTETKKRGQFFDHWSDFKKSVDLMASGNVVIQSMWSPAVTRVRQMGKPCIYQPLEEGYRGWCYGMSVPSTLSGRKLDAVYEFMNWYNSGWVGGFMNRPGYYFNRSRVCRTTHGSLRVGLLDEG